MLNKKLTGIALAIGAASVFALAPAISSADQSHAGEIKCEGANECKGKSQCKSAADAGKNSCKGQGMIWTKTEADCEAAKKKVAEGK